MYVGLQILVYVCVCCKFVGARKVNVVPNLIQFAMTSYSEPKKKKRKKRQENCSEITVERNEIT